MAVAITIPIASPPPERTGIQRAGPIVVRGIHRQDKLSTPRDYANA
jgi:hypothetical protein